jgi:hypothetical protein
MAWKSLAGITPAILLLATDNHKPHEKHEHFVRVITFFVFVRAVCVVCGKFFQ